MHHPGWILVIVGAAIAIIAVVWLSASSIPWPGKLPGDIAVEGRGFNFYFPVVTCVVMSLLLSGILVVGTDPIQIVCWEDVCCLEMAFKHGSFANPRLSGDMIWSVLFARAHAQRTVPAMLAST